MAIESLLVCSVGVSDYDEIKYATGESNQGTYRTELSPVAVAAILDIDAALVFRTPEAGEEWDDDLKDRFGEVNVEEYTFVDIPRIGKQAHVDDILNTIVGTIRQREINQPDVVLDITHSFRSLAMVFFLALTHLDALDEITLEEVKYSEFAGSSDHDESPMIDLTHLTTLMEWHYALQTAETTGSLRGVYRLLEEHRGKLITDDESKHFLDAISRINGVRKYLDIGFPLETGLAARQAMDRLEAVDDTKFVGPEGMVVEPLRQRIRPFAIKQNATKKEDIVLDMEELERQASMVDYYRTHGEVLKALTCARELWLNRVLYERGYTDHWPEGGRDTVRPGPAEVRDPDHGTVTLWDRISTARNMYAHAGFKAEGKPADSSVDEILVSLCDRIDDDAYWAGISE